MRPHPARVPAPRSSLAGFRLALGGQAKSAELRSWASRELNGYKTGDDDLPEWRIVGATLHIDGQNLRAIIKGQQISPMTLPDFARDVIKEECPLRMGVAALEAMLARSEEFAHLGPPGASDLVLYMNHKNSNQFEHIESLYWSISKTAIRGVLDRIRTTLVELVAEMRAGMPEDMNVPTAELASQAVNVAVHGRGHRVTVTTAQSGTDGSSQATGPTEEGKTRNWKRWAKIGGFIVGLATVIATLITSAEFLSKPADPQRPNPSSSVVTSTHKP
jgi:AbiTii